MVSETAIGLILSTASMLMWFNALETNPEHKGIRLLHNLMSLGLMLIAINVCLLMAKNDDLGHNIVRNIEVFYQVFLVVVTFTVGYWIIMYVKDVLLRMGYLKKKGED